MCALSLIRPTAEFALLACRVRLERSDLLEGFSPVDNGVLDLVASLPVAFGRRTRGESLDDVLERLDELFFFFDDLRELEDFCDCWDLMEIVDSSRVSFSVERRTDTSLDPSLINMPIENIRKISCCHNTCFRWFDFFGVSDAYPALLSVLSVLGVIRG